MNILNASDDDLHGTFSVDAPMYQDHSEYLVPPRGFLFAAGEVTEDVPDAAGEHFLKKFGPRGLIRMKLGDDMELLRGRARRAWLRDCERQMNEWEMANGARLAQGLPRLTMPEPLFEVAMIQKRLHREINGEELNVDHRTGFRHGQDPLRERTVEQEFSARRESVADMDAAINRDRLARQQPNPPAA